MNTFQKKITRYKNLLLQIKNWKYYLLRKVFGFKSTFSFDIKSFRRVTVPKNMLGTFKESFLDNVYFKNIPEAVFKDKKTLTFIDIGANVGFFSLAAFSKFPKAAIHAFEPHPYCFKILSGYKNDYNDLEWQVYNKAVSDSNGQIELNTTTLDAFSTMSGTFKIPRHNQTFTTDAIRLDTHLEKNNISRIDLLKLDCEGAEYSILYSLSKTTYNIIDSLCIETHRGAEESQNIDALTHYLQELGYKTKTEDEELYAGYLWAWK